MEKKYVVTTTQMFALLFLSAIVVGLTYNLPMSKSNNLQDHIASAFIAMGLSFVLIMPVYKLYQINNAMNIADSCMWLFKKFGIVFLIVYGLYYIFASCYILSLFNIFVGNIMSLNVSPFFLTLAVVVTASYAACKGIEGIARGGIIIFFIICIAIIFIVITLIPQVDIMNYSPLLYKNMDETLNGVFYILSLAFYIPLAGILFPFIKGNVKKTVCILNFSVYGILILAMFIVSGALGDYLKTQTFPIYSATSVAEIGVFRRLDAVYLGIFTMGLFITISLFLLAFYLVMKKMLGEKRGKFIVALGDILVLLISLVLPLFSNLFYNMKFILLFTILTSFFIPIILLIRYNILKKKGEVK